MLFFDLNGGNFHWTSAVRGGNAGWPAPFRPTHRGPARPAPHILCGPHTLARPAFTLARGPAHFFFIIIIL